MTRRLNSPVGYRTHFPRRSHDELVTSVLASMVRLADENCVVSNCTLSTIAIWAKIDRPRVGPLLDELAALGHITIISRWTRNANGVYLVHIDNAAEIIDVSSLRYVRPAIGNTCRVCEILIWQNAAEAATRGLPFSRVINLAVGELCVACASEK